MIKINLFDAVRCDYCVHSDVCIHKKYMKQTKDVEADLDPTLIYIRVNCSYFKSEDDY